MKLAYYIKSEALTGDPRVASLLAKLREGGCELSRIAEGQAPEPDTAMVLSLGGDGTFLSASHIAAPCGLPVFGVNFGHLGFLSENSAQDVLDAILSGSYAIQERTMLQAHVEGSAVEGEDLLFALNEISVSRVSAQMLAVDVTLDGKPLPTYRADGLLVSTSSGSTAYSLSVGGPVCMPDSKVLILAPVAPHNLNVRPLVVPEDAVLQLAPRTREGAMVLTVDNRTFTLEKGCRVTISAAPVRLRRGVTGKSNFIEALKDRLLWGGDVRNTMDNN